MVYGSHEGYDKLQKNSAYRTFRDLDLVVEQARRTLEPVKDKFSSIVVTGISGLSAGAPVALAIGKPLVVVRKHSNDDICGSSDVVGYADLGDSPMFFDDLISSGTTFRRCQGKIGVPFKCTYLYEKGEFEDKEGENMEDLVE